MNLDGFLINKKRKKLVLCLLSNGERTVNLFIRKFHNPELQKQLQNRIVVMSHFHEQSRNIYLDVILTL